MKRVVIWGTGTTYANYKFILKDDLEIVAFVETEPKETFFEGKPVLSPDELSTVEYDDIIVFSIYHDAIFDKVREYNIKGAVILSDQYDQYEEYVRLSGENPFHKKLNKLDGVKNAEVLITGLSYHDEGISVDQFARPVINMAMGSQDLFYDYEMVKYVLEEKRLEGVKYCIVGMAYFSMEYDYSKSCGAGGIIRYYPEIADSHNMMESEFFPIYAEREIRRLEQYRYLAQFFDIKRGANCKISEEEGRRAAETDFNKHYSLTIFENQCILDHYLTFLENHKIKPIIVIMPAHPYYTQYIPQEKKELFHRSLNEVLMKHNVQVLDYLDSYECPETHYYHVSHFNETGANEFTKRLIRDIAW